MAQRPKFSSYNDGVLSVYKDKGERSNFGAKVNPNALDALELVVKLAFAEMSKRESDMEFAESMQFSLDAKVKTRYVAGVTNKSKVIIGDTLYDISYIDTTRTEMFLYLHKIDTLKRGASNA